VPLTPHRALACSKNPDAGATANIGLLIALADDRCAGYLGLMPGRLFTGGTFHPIHWFSTWFVAPEFRSAGVGVRLLLEGMKLGHDLAVTGTSPEADRIYRGLGFREIGPLTFVRLDRTLLRRAGLALDTLVHGSWRRSLRQITVRDVPRFEDDPGPEPGPSCFHRGLPVINWMLADRWIREIGTGPAALTGYAFSQVRDRFRYVALEIGRPGARAPGFLVMSISTERSRTILKTLDYRAAAGDRSVLLPLVLDVATTHSADRIEMPLPIFEAGRPGALLRLLPRPAARPYFCHPRPSDSPLAVALRDLRLDYCDGDTAFA